MKHLKIYEYYTTQEESVYWRINTKSLEHILLSLKKIGLTPEDEIYDNIVNTFKDENFREIDDEFFYIGRGLDEYNTDYWYWSYNINNFKNQSSSRIKNQKFEFKGLIKIEDWELAADKYNL
jgi:hypothetical protein